LCLSVLAPFSFRKRKWKDKFSLGYYLRLNILTETAQIINNPERTKTITDGFLACFLFLSFFQRQEDKEKTGEGKEKNAKRPQDIKG